MSSAVERRDYAYRKVRLARAAVDILMTFKDSVHKSCFFRATWLKWCDR